MLCRVSVPQWESQEATLVRATRRPAHIKLSDVTAHVAVT